MAKRMRKPSGSGAVIVSNDLAAASRMARAGCIRLSGLSTSQRWTDQDGVADVGSLCFAHNGPELRSFRKASILDFIELPPIRCGDGHSVLARNEQQENRKTIKPILGKEVLNSAWARLC